MKNERHCACLLLNLCKNLKVETCPVFGILAVDVTDACCEHCNTEICNHLAFCGICNLTAAYNTVFLAADSAYLSFNGNTLSLCICDDLLCLSDIFVDCVVRAVEHN